MQKKEICAIDARMIETSGIGTYIRMVMQSGIYNVALGSEKTIHKYFPDIYVIPFQQKIYGIKEQLCFPYRRLRKMGVNVFHSPHYNAPLFWRQKLFVTIHDLIHLKFPEYLPNRLAYLYARIMLKWDCLCATTIFAVSEYTKRDIVKTLHVKESKIKITYNAVESCFKVKQKQEVAYLYSKYKFPAESKVVLYVGNIKPHKNVQAIVEAIREIQDNSLWLVLAGRAFGQNVKELLNIDAKIESRVILTGEIEQREVVDWYNLASVFVFPSLYEGFGIPPLEAMACGTPVICSNVSSLPEVVGDAGVMIDPMDINALRKAIVQVVNLNEEKYLDYVKKGYERVKYFKGIRN